MKKLFLIFISFFVLPTLMQSKGPRILTSEKSIKRQCKLAQRNIEKTQKLIKQNKPQIRFLKNLSMERNNKVKLYMLKKFIRKFDKSTPYTTYCYSLNDQIQLMSSQIIKLKRFTIQLNNQAHIYPSLSTTIIKAQQSLHQLSTLKLFIQCNCQEQLKQESPHFKFKKLIKIVLIAIAFIKFGIILHVIISPFLMWGVLVFPSLAKIPLFIAAPAAAYTTNKHKVSKREKVFNYV